MKCKHFAIHELVPLKVYTARGQKAWQLLDPKLVELLDALREHYGRATVNNYFWGGMREWSGLRTPDSKYFSPYSQHTFGRAVDILFNDISAEDVRKDIIAKPDKWLEIAPSISLETDISWFHVDIRNGNLGINTFKP